MRFETPWMIYNYNSTNFKSTWQYSPYGSDNDRIIPNVFCLDGINKYYKIKYTDTVRLVFDEKKYLNTPTIRASFLNYAGLLAILNGLRSNGYDEVKQIGNEFLYVKRGKVAITLQDLKLSWWAEVKK